jgi:hypothetical protein
MANASTIGPNAVSKHHLERLLALSKRRTGLQLPVSFVKSETQPTPLVSILRGGHSGEVRLKLYLCLMLLAVQAPHRIKRDISARTWAETIGLPNAEQNGSRRISEALNWLERRNFITLERRHGMPPLVTLLSPLGNGASYARPGVPYLSIPIGFWSSQWITTLSGTAIVLLLILLDLTGGKSRDPSQSASREQRLRYNLSQDSWHRGASELVKHGLIVVGRTARSHHDFEMAKARNTYLVVKKRFDKEP